MRALPRLAVLALLGGCEAQLTVDLTDGPLETANEVVLDVTHVALQADDGSVLQLPVDDGTPFDLLLFQKGQAWRLVTDAAFEGDRFTGIALDFADGNSYVTRDDGARVDLVTPVARDFAPIDLLLDDLDEEDLVIDLNLRFSVIDDGSGDYQLVPVWRAVRPGDAGGISGAVASAFVESDTCRAGRPIGQGVAVYLIEGNGATPADYAGQSTLIDAARVESDGTQYRYSLHFVPAGDYTLALTCQADDDDPRTDDAVAFADSGNVTVTAGGTATLDFSP